MFKGRLHEKGMGEIIHNVGICIGSLAVKGVLTPAEARAEYIGSQINDM